MTCITGIMDVDIFFSKTFQGNKYLLIVRYLKHMKGGFYIQSFACGHTGCLTFNCGFLDHTYRATFGYFYKFQIIFEVRGHETII